ncbi:MAG: PspA-associated protein PspAB [Thermoleophilaceae bacterium]|jgi:hypothetical protein
MGFLDTILGGGKKLKGPAPDRLFAMTTAQVQLDAGLGLKANGVAGIAFQQVATADFKQILADTEELLHGSAEDTGTKIDSADDEYGFRWVILRDSDFDDLLVAMNTVSSELQGGGYGDRLLCAVFSFDEDGRKIYFIYNFKRGSFYPFVPTGEKQRNTEREFQLRAQIGNELPIEPETARWLPLWDLPL